MTMTSLARKLVFAFVVAVYYIGATSSQEPTGSERRYGRLIRDVPMPNVTKDKDGMAVMGGPRPLFLRSGGLLVATDVRPRDIFIERFLAFPLGENNAVSVVDKPTDACQWVVKRQRVGSGTVDPKARDSTMTLKTAVRFVASAGPFKDGYLCVDQQNRLVMGKEADALVWKAEFEDNWDGK